MEKDQINTKKYRHVRILRTLLLVIGLGSLLVFAVNISNFVEDYESLFANLRLISLFLIGFLFIFSAFNVHLIAGENKSKHIFGHLFFLFIFLFYIVAHSLELLYRLNNGTLNDLLINLNINVYELYLNQLLIAFVIPSIMLTTLVWSMRNIKPIQGNNRQSNSSTEYSYYLFVLLTVLGLIYSALTPLYSIL